MEENLEQSMYVIDPIVRYQYFENLKRRTIVFNRMVDEDILEYLILPLRQFEEDDSNEPVNLILNTCGGSTMAGLVVLNLIDKYKKTLNIYVYSYAMSMGAIILAAGNKNPNVRKFAHKFSIGLIHSGDVVLGQSTANQAKDTMNFLQDIDKRIEQYFFENTNFTKAVWKKIKDKEFYMTAEEMKKYGLIDEIL